jgi:hypothetical protein
MNYGLTEEDWIVSVMLFCGKLCMFCWCRVSNWLFIGLLVVLTGVCRTSVGCKVSVAWKQRV